ncbi:hypothetical protein EAF00_001778 [Botryotinia globosa]|nr:hypothetical protein EAF00_001778 [Botryotinia globosa]
MVSHFKHFLLSLIFYTADLGNQTPAFDDLVSSKFHSSTNNGTALAPLDGRSLLKSWLSPRVLTCEDPGYGLCPSNLGYCPKDENCCGSSFCVKPGESCCQGFTCEVGWNCCTYPYCYPDGGNCCSDGSYCTAGNICVNTPPSLPTQTEQTTDPHTEVGIDTQSSRGTGPASYSVSSTLSTTTRSVTSGSSSSSTATSTLAVVTVSGASGIRLDRRLWSITGFMVFCTCIVALWLL